MNNAAFFKAMRADRRLGARRLSPVQVQCAEAILRAGAGLRLDALAYVLATAWHEAKLTPQRENMNYSAKRIREVWPGRPYAVRYANNPKGLANHVYGDRLGNRPGTDDGWNFRGGGLDQLTGRDNYTRVGIAGAPDTILNPEVAVRSLVNGMTLGRYRGHKLSDFFTDTQSDFVGARAVVNADVKRVGPPVAVYALAFRDALVAAGYDGIPAPPDVEPVEPALPTPPKRAMAGGAVFAVLVAAALAYLKSKG